MLALLQGNSLKNLPVQRYSNWKHPALREVCSYAVMFLDLRSLNQWTPKPYLLHKFPSHTLWIIQDGILSHNRYRCQGAHGKIITGVWLLATRGNSCSSVTFKVWIFCQDEHGCVLAAGTKVSWR